MEEKLKDLILEYIDGNLSGELEKYVAKNIQENDECRKYYEDIQKTYQLLESDIDLQPDSSLKLDFEKALEEEIAADKPKGKQAYFPMWKMAASVALVLSGVFIGAWWMKGQKNDQIDALASEVRATREMVLQSLDNQQSASARLQGVNVAYSVDKADDAILKALVRTLNNDKNTNVRLAAMEALARFSDQPGVMAALLSSMEKQTDPIVQINLINLMVSLKEKGAVGKLQEIIQSDSTQQAVKDEAHMAVYKLI